jgi:hypothetical protein
VKVLLTNNSLYFPAGTELYVRDVALELMRRGHQPVAYSTKLGAVAEELRSAGATVIDSLQSFGQPPDIIHGHHHYETLAALVRFPGTPAIYFCHGWLPWQEAPLRSPQIRRYVAVDELCRERLMAEGGIAADDIEVHPNFFDGSRFLPRPPLPSKPVRALVFGHLYREEAELAVLREACRLNGIDLNAAGHGVGAIESNPERRLREYDLVFAKARCAIEAMAVGASVILCGYGKLGPIVTSENFDELRRWNFGMRTLCRPLTVEGVQAELRRYDPAESAVVTRLTRTRSELSPAVDRLVALYSRVLEGVRERPMPTTEECGRAAAKYLETWADRYKRGAEAAFNDHQWAERAMSAEAGLRAAEEECRRRSQQLESAEKSVGQVRAGVRRLEAENLGLESQVRNAEAQLARVEAELRSVKASATWRWSQAILGHSVTQMGFGWWIRSIAGRSSSRTK